MKPFLLLGTRAEDAAARSEHLAVARFAGLEPEQLHHVRLEARPMPAIDLDDWSGIILGGSPFTTSDPPEHKSAVQHRVENELAHLLDRVIERDVPFLGACYGVGTLGVRAGGLVDRTYGEPVGAVEVHLTDAGLTDPLTRDLPPAFHAFVGHKEAVTVPPPGAVVLATSGPCPVQAFRLRSNLYATQFHPELDVAGIVERVRIYRDAGYFEAHELDQVVRALEGAEVVHPPTILAAFVRRYAR